MTPEAEAQAALAALHLGAPPALPERLAALRRLAAALAADSEGMAAAITTATRKPITLARAEVGRGVALLEATATAAEQLLAPRRVEVPSGSAVLHHVPVGPVLAVTPFNFPLNLSLHKLAPALAAGAPVLWKPSPLAPGVAERVLALLGAAGVQPDAVVARHLSDDAVAAACADERLRLLSFTGSARVGRLLQERVRRARVLLELGGNACVILHEAADPAAVAAAVARDACAHAGQVCISVQRILYPAGQPQWREHLVTGFRAVATGDPWDPATVCGPVISPAARTRITALLADYRAAGGRVLTGGTWDGLTLAPTLLEGVPATHPGVRATEAFAPLATLHPYRSLEEACAIAEDTPFGLQAGIYATDPAVIAAVFAAVTVGTLVVNDTPARRDDRLPYGGCKESGVGREGADATVLDYATTRVLYQPHPR